MPAMFTKNYPLIPLLLGAAIAVPCIVLRLVPYREPQGEAASAPASRTRPSARTAAMRQKVGRLRPGMTDAEVAAILGLSAQYTDRRGFEAWAQRQRVTGDAPAPVYDPAVRIYRYQGGEIEATFTDAAPAGRFVSAMGRPFPAPPARP